MSSAARHICLITPGHLSGNPRIVKEADALSGAGYKVTVIASRFLPGADAADEAFMHRAWTARRGVAFGPLASRPAYLWQSVMRHGARRAMRIVPHLPGIAERACHPAAAALKSAALDVKADLYIAHYTAALPAAAHAAARHGTLFGFDAEDFHPGDLPDQPEHAFEKKIIDVIERRYLPKAAHLTAASPGIAEAYAQRYGFREPAVVLNVFDPPPDATALRRDGVQSPSLYWFSQTIGPGRGLESAAEAIGVARSAPHFYLRGRGSESYIGHLRAIAAKHGAQSRLHVLAPSLPTELEAEGMQFDAGYAGETGFSPNNRLALANKLFSYLASGLAVIMSDTPAHCHLAPELEGAARLFPAGDAKSLASALDDLFLDRATLAAARARSRALAKERFNWAVESRVLVNAVGAAFASRAPA